MNNIILIGYMGSGKSAVGRRLSYRIKSPYIDTDKEIERKQKIKIKEIFATQGEEVFRDMETECIKSLFDMKQRYVISVGGGLPLREENRSILNELGKVIYLRATPETIYERLKDDTSRPLLQGGGARERIRNMILQRDPIYEDASNVIIDVDGKNFDEIMDEIEEVIK